MAFRQRAAPWMIAALVGIGSGVYIFDPIMRQYVIDSRGTFDPEIAKAAEAGGLGGGVNDATKVAEQKEKTNTSQLKAKVDKLVGK
jgi:hypothetical protein